MQLWAMFGLASKAANKNQCTKLVPYESVCEIYVPQLLLMLSLPDIEQKKSYCGLAIFKAKGI
jgi:hypothetical protein